MLLAVINSTIDYDIQQTIELGLLAYVIVTDL